MTGEGVVVVCTWLLVGVDADLAGLGGLRGVSWDVDKGEGRDGGVVEGLQVRVRGVIPVDYTRVDPVWLADCVTRGI